MWTIRPRLNPSSIAASLLGGLTNAALAVALIDRAGVPVVDSSAGVAAVAVVAFWVGFVPAVLSAHTRLLSPAIGLAALLVGVAYAALTSPPAVKLYELGGHDILSEPTLFSRYATVWPAWFALLLVAGVVEFAIRRGYDLGSHRLRNLPSLPLSRARTGLLVGGASGLVGIGSVLTFGPSYALVAFAFAAAVTAVPLAALLSRGLLAPTVLFAIWVPRTFHVEAFDDPHGPLHLVSLLPVAVACAIAWLLEALLRSRYRGWDGGGFTDGGDPA